MKQPSVELHIEKLVLDGFASADHAQIGRAVEHELARLFAEQGVPPALARGDAAPRLDGGAFEIKRGSSAAAIGAQIAKAVYGGLAK